MRWRGRLIGLETRGMKLVMMLMKRSVKESLKERRRERRRLKRGELCYMGMMSCSFRAIMCIIKALRKANERGRRASR
jgi:hypothetical protein